MPLRFHWMLPLAGETAIKTPEATVRYRIDQTSNGSPVAQPDVESWLPFARAAEEATIDSVLISFSRHEPDPMFVACALGRATQRLKFIVAYRAGLIQPTLFVHQMNTLSALIGGRVAFNVVAGSSKPESFAYGDFLEHDQRYARADEFVTVCRALWRGNGKVNFDGEHYRVEQGEIPTRFGKPGTMPEIYVSGHSEGAEALARSNGSCLLRVADTVESLEPLVARAREHGLEVCLRMCVLCRPTREEAVATAESLKRHGGTDGMWKREGYARDDSKMYREAWESSEDWLSPYLWTGMVPVCGPVWTTLLGTPEEVAEVLLAYKRIGVTQFIMSGYPDIEEVERFGREVVPLVREAEGP
jgi:alkanesulfonate monooxygenase